MKLLKVTIIYLCILICESYSFDFKAEKKKLSLGIKLLTDYYIEKDFAKDTKDMKTSTVNEWSKLLGDDFKILPSMDGEFVFNHNDVSINITIRRYATLDQINEKGIRYYIFNHLFFQYMFYGNVSAAINNLYYVTLNGIGDIYTYSINKKVFIRGNAYVKVSYGGNRLNNKEMSTKLFQLAKKIDHKICELNGIPYDPNFPEKEDNDSEEDKEVKRKIADGTYTKIEDLPKPQSQSDNVKNNVKDPQEEKTVTKIDSPISPKIENSKSKIFGILFTVVFGGFLLIYKKCKKKNKIKNTELNN